MKPAPALCRRLLLCLVCAASGSAGAAAPQAAAPTSAGSAGVPATGKPGAAATTAPATTAPTPAAPAPAPATAADAVSPPDQDLAALGAALADERRTLQAGGGEFAVFVRVASREPAHGTLVLLPGDGTHPAAAAALDRIRHVLPDSGWSSWLLSLDPPPRAWAGKLAGEAQQPGAEVSIDEMRARELRQWAARCQERIATATAAAAAEGGAVVLVAEGSAAALLTAATGTATGAVRGAVLLEPVEFSGLPADWPEDTQVPVLEVLSPSLALAAGTERREHARSRGVQRYRQLTLQTADWYPQRGEDVLSRRLRGWLSVLPASPATAPGAN